MTCVKPLDTQDSNTAYLMWRKMLDMLLYIDTVLVILSEDCRTVELKASVIAAKLIKEKIRSSFFLNE